MTQVTHAGASSMPACNTCVALQCSRNHPYLSSATCACAKQSPTDGSWHFPSCACHEVFTWCLCHQLCMRQSSMCSHLLCCVGFFVPHKAFTYSCRLASCCNPCCQVNKLHCPEDARGAEGSSSVLVSSQCCTAAPSRAGSQRAALLCRGDQVSDGLRGVLCTHSHPAGVPSLPAPAQLAPWQLWAGHRGRAASTAGAGSCTCMLAQKAKLSGPEQQQRRARLSGKRHGPAEPAALTLQGSMSQSGSPCHAI